MSNQEPKKVNQLNKIIEIAKKPTTIIVGVGALTLGAVGYAGARFFIQQNLPSIIEDQLSKIVQSPVKISNIENLSLALNHLEIPLVQIGPSQSDQDQVIIRNIKIDYNILPLLLFRPLPASVSVGEVNVYLEQDSAGNWVNLNLPKQQQPGGKLPIGLDVSLAIPDVDISLKPYTTPNPIQILAVGSGRYIKTDNQLLQADLDATVAGAKVKLKGNTTIETGSSDLQLLIEDLSLPGLTPLIAKTPVQINQGNLDADVNLRLPSFENIEASNGQGKFNLENIQATLEPLKKPLLLDARLNLIGQKILVETGQASLGDIVATLTGEVDWRMGYNLAVFVKPFSLGNLAQNLRQPLPLPLDGRLQAKLDITGPVLEPEIKGTVNSTQPLVIDKVKINQIATTFEANLKQITLEELKIQPTAGGEITAKGQLITNLSEVFQNKQAINWAQMPLNLNFRAQLPTQALFAPYYTLPSQITVGDLVASGNLGGTLNNPEGAIKWLLPPGNTSRTNKISGTGELVAKNRNITLNNTKIQALGGNIEVSGKANLDNQKWQTAVNASSLPLNPFLVQIPQVKSQLNLSKPIAISKAFLDFSGQLNELQPSKINGNGKVSLNLDRGLVNLETQLRDGNITLAGTGKEIALSELIPSLPVQVVLNQGQLQGSARLEQLLSFGQKQDLSSVRLNAQGNVLVSEGTLLATASLINNQWRSNINAANINTNQIISKFYPSIPSLPRLNALANLSGDISTLFQANTPANIAVNDIQVNLGPQSLKAKGNLSVVNITRKPDVGNLNLDVQANADLQTIPLKEFLDGLPLKKQQRDLLPQDLNLKGLADFNGSLQGKNLLSAPLDPGNLALRGNLDLSNLSVSDRTFEPRLSGPVSVITGDQVLVDLRGKQDAIALRLDACRDATCRLPYLPNFVEFHQGKPGDEIAISGNRQGSNFVASVKRFPLNFLNVAPAESFGFPGILNGEVQANIDLNMFTYATQGNVRVFRPAIGAANLDEVEANFAYNLEGNQLQLASATVLFGNSEYNLNGDLNLASGAINAKLDLTKGYVEDIFNALKIFSVQDLAKVFTNYKYATASTLGAMTLGDRQYTISQELNLLWLIDQQILQLAQQINVGGAPIQLDIQGRYSGGVTVAGNLNNPQVDLKVQGDDWQWRVKPAVLNILDPLGLVWQENELIPIPELLVEAKYIDGDLSVSPFRLGVGDMKVSFVGNVTKQTNIENSQLKVENLSVDLVRSLFKIPVDVSGKVNLEANFAGSVKKPEVTGEVAFLEGAYNGLGINQDFKGAFTYQDARLDFRTSEPKYIDLQASVPFPVQPQVNDQVNLNLKVDKEALSLVNVLTQKQLAWKEGDFSMDVQGKARLDLNTPQKVENIDATGKIVFNNTVFQSVNLGEEVNVNGEINLQNQKVIIPNLSGTLDQAQASITGVLPLLYPLPSGDPDSNNPLLVEIKQGRVDFANLFAGNVDADISVDGFALQPVIAGQVTLSNGNVSLPENSGDNNVPTAPNPWLKPSKATQKTGGFAPVLNNFEISLNNLTLESYSLYKFTFSGDLKVNGTLDNINNLKPEGTIKLDRGDITFFGTNFFIAPRYDSLITFKPEQGVLNPDLDIKMETVLSEFNTQSPQSNPNETRQDLFRSRRPNTVKVTLSIDGRADQIIPSLNKNIAQFCGVALDEPPVMAQPGYTQPQLDQYSTCLQSNFYATESDRSLLTNPAVSLSSDPPRPEGEIIGLLGQQFLGLAEQLQGGKSDELLQLGLEQFLLGPLQRDALYQVDRTVSGIGQKIGLQDLRLYPLVETNYRLNNTSSLRFTYDYYVDEFGVRYQIRF